MNITSRGGGSLGDDSRLADRKEDPCIHRFDARAYETPNIPLEQKVASQDTEMKTTESKMSKLHLCGGKESEVPASVAVSIGKQRKPITNGSASSMELGSSQDVHMEPM